MSFELALPRHANDPAPFTWFLILPRRWMAGQGDDKGQP
jgi:hypothetical protein